MTRYYFDLLDEDGLFIDEEGLEFSDLRAVQSEAAKSLADMAREAVHGSPGLSRRDMMVDVRDKVGPVMQIRFNFDVERMKQ